MSILDLVEEGCRTWHPIDYNASSADQKEEALKSIQVYLDRRLLKFVKYFDYIIEKNTMNNGQTS
eukprot:CAMPEP_0116962976 /NCGR_PEP_ID=MMETSP0467-20121206/47621_1 /TAXON_ID=283647 /ORGANISM="Mesodinium pulex, Strain SPMC105" /LENGTH=64 /DNA_ID=CAMNT_0004651487 /DNA_START=146 /DNA_END=340 /DNA_ORIENTATION=-